jgi:hypothetical protein
MAFIEDFEISTDSGMQAAYVTNDGYGNTGGTITTDGLYKVHTFLIGDTGTNFVPIKAGNVEVLVVAGGGGGSDNGGGGAGGVLYSASFAVTAQAYTITVGAGGNAGPNDGQGTKGANSVFSSLTAYGGGTGTIYQGTTNNLTNGGSGGGGAADVDGGTGVDGQGYKGGHGVNNYFAGGGGGAGEAGKDSAGTVSGAGGAGVSTYSALLIAANAGVDISGTHWIGGGGGGGASGGTRGLGGNGGGGNGGCGIGTAGLPSAGVAGSGGGGGGGDGNPGADYLPQAGGSGIVIIRCLASDFSTLQSYSESTIKTQGSYALKAVAAITDSLNKTLTKTF